MTTEHRTVTDEGGLTRSALLRRAAVGGTALMMGGGVVPTSFAGPLRYAGRALKGTLSIVQ